MDSNTFTIHKIYALFGSLAIAEGWAEDGLILLLISAQRKPFGCLPKDLAMPIQALTEKSSGLGSV